VKIHLYTYKTTYSKMFAHYTHAFLLIYCTTPCESWGRCFSGHPVLVAKWAKVDIRSLDDVQSVAVLWTTWQI